MTISILETRPLFSLLLGTLPRTRFLRQEIATRPRAPACASTLSSPQRPCISLPGTSRVMMADVGRLALDGRLEDGITRVPQIT